MNCETVRNRLGAYLDGELLDDAPVREHLRQCSRCRAELEELRRLDGVLTHLPAARTRSSFALDVRAAAEQEREAGRRILPFAVLRQIRVPTAAAASVAVALGLALGVFMSRAVTAADGAAAEAAQVTEMDYHIDALSAVPESSLAGAYIEAIADDGAGRSENE